MSDEGAGPASGSAPTTSWTETVPNGLPDATTSTHVGVNPAKATKRLKPKPLKEVLEKVLPLLQRRDLYQFFALPVSATEVPDYYTVIKQPMDFATIEQKLKDGRYNSLDSFRSDFLLITENAQYFNAIDGPSGIIHTEAKKLQEWGVRVIAREGAAVADEVDDKSDSLNGPIKAHPMGNGKLNIRLKKGASAQSSTISTPRVSTPSRLQQEIKVEDDSEEEEDDDKDDDEEDDDSEGEEEQYSETGESSTRGASTSIDGFGIAKTRDSPDTSRHASKKHVGSRAPYMHKKNRPRISAVAGLLSAADAVSQHKEGGRPVMAPVSSVSGAVAAAIPLAFGPDGAIELERLTEDERRAILRAADADQWSDVLMPFNEALLPLPIEVQTQASNLSRPIKDVVDGLGSALLSAPASIAVSYNYDVGQLSLEQQSSPFAISSGHEFEGAEDEKASIPLAWPRPPSAIVSGAATSTASPAPTPGGETTSAPFRQLKGKDRDKEREAAGVGNLDDWTFSRASLAKLIQPLDIGLYPGLLPAAWISHIKSSKGGPGRSRLPPFHLSTGATYETALQDELASLPHRVLLGGKPGVINGPAAPVDTSRDLCSLLAKESQRDWLSSEEALKKAGARGSDIVREVVFGGPLGEAYTSSIYTFVKGAAEAAASTREQSFEDDGEHDMPTSTAPRREAVRVVPSYFDEMGEMLDPDGYHGMGIIPLDVRKEAGLSAQSVQSRAKQPLPFDPPTSSRKRESREPSILSSGKRIRLDHHPNDATPFLKEDIDSSIDDDEKDTHLAIEEEHSHADSLREMYSAYLSGSILDGDLVTYVRDTIISPLTGNLLDILVRAGDELSWENAPDTAGDLPDHHWSSSLVSLNALIPEDLINVLHDTTRKSHFEGDKDLLRALIKNMISGEYSREKRKVEDLTRVTEEVIELDDLVRNKDEMLNEAQQSNVAMPLRYSSLELDQAKAAKALEQYGHILRTLEKTPDKAKMAQLRLAYIALAKMVPTKDLARGQWAAWAEYFQQQIAQQKQWQAQQQPLSNVSSAATADISNISHI